MKGMKNISGLLCQTRCIVDTDLVGILKHLDRVVDPDLFIDVGAMFVDGFGTDIELFADLSATVSCYQKLKNLLFT